MDRTSSRPPDQSGRRCALGGFTLTELLVILAIIALLMAALLPALERARARGREIQCASNMRQIATALLTYASDFKQCFPLNLTIPAPGRLWSDRERIGKYIKDLEPGDPRGVTGPIFTCPADDGGRRSYSMNVWASPKVDASLTTGTKRGEPWKAGSRMRPSTQMILLVETWSYLGPTADGGYMSHPLTGFASMPCRRFGGGGGIIPNRFVGRFGFVNCEIDYSRHRRQRTKALTEPRGDANFAYADGHVASKRHDELVDYRTGRSTLDSWWSALDPLLEGALASGN